MIEAFERGATQRLVELEGMLLAQRKLLVQLAAGSDRRADLSSWLAERGAFQGNDEDPGLVPDEAFALQAAIAEEFRRLSEALAAEPG
ncbi:hypothetical protein V8J36_09055 [Frigidibacter sp. MR17.14]|uniref:hypothetical protein n=1 Tax=Frigidibacter sp. MR17.14 TaxID=3126509 RepID=UPI003012F8D7